MGARGFWRRLVKRRKESEKQSYILTRETLGMTITLFCALVVIMLLTNKYVFGGLGKAICTFMYGTFGYASYVVVAALAYLGEVLVFEKKIKFNRRFTLSVSAAAIVLFLLFHAVSTRSYSIDGYGGYLSSCYLNAANGYSGYTFGGVLAGLIVYPVAKLTTYIGAYVIFSLLFVLCAYFVVLAFMRLYVGKRAEEAVAGATVSNEEKAESVTRKDERVDRLYSVNEDHEIVNNVKREHSSAPRADSNDAANSSVNPVNKEDTAPAENDKFSNDNLGRKILFEPGEFAAESYRRNMIYNENSYFNHPVHNDDDYIQSFTDGKTKPVQPKANEEKSYTDGYSESVESDAHGYSSPAYTYGDIPVESLGDPSSIRMEKPYDSYTVNKPSEASVYGEAERGYSQPENAAPYGERVAETPAPENPAPRAESVSDGRTENTWQSPARDTNASAESLAPERGRDGGDRNSIYNLFSSSNPNLEKGGVEPDSSVLSRDGRGTKRGGSFGDDTRDGTTRESASRDSLFSDNTRNDATRESASRDSLFSDNARGETTRESGSRDSLFGDDTRSDATRERASRESLFDDKEEDDSLFGISRGGLRGGDEAPRSDRGESLSVDGKGNGFLNGSRTTDGAAAPSESNPVHERGTLLHAEEPKPAEPEPAPAPEPPKPHVWKKYVRPTLDLLEDYPENNNVNTGEIEENKQTICDTLAAYHIACHVSNVTVGPAITRYDIIVEDRTNIKAAMKYREAIAMALMKDNVNAFLNYSKGAISIEVPNTKRTLVGLKGMLASSQFINSKPNTLTFALGKSVDGEVVCPDITEMPHLLVAGTTGSGKSICLNSLIISLLYKYGPNELRFILVDPKQVEFISFDKLPHLMINEILYDVDKTIKALNWAIKEMEHRYQLFKEMTESGVATKNLTEYNSHVRTEEEKLPKIVIILDEFGDLMMQAKKDIEGRIIRLVQKSRACGIHLILATQRPSTDCITGLIKSNLPTRIGFKVNSYIDSMTIFDVGGAEKLLGKGDLYFRSVKNPELSRVQGCFIDTPEVQKVTDFVKANNETFFDQSVSDFINTVEEEPTNESTGGGVDASNETKIDDTFIKALSFCVTSNQASVSMIQRRFPIGYMKACKIIDWMENMNYVTQSEGSKPRKVLLSREEFVSKYGDVDD